MMKTEIITHNILTSINGADEDKAPMFDVYLLSASPIADRFLTNFVLGYASLLELHTCQGVAVKDSLRALWAAPLIVFRELAYRPTAPTLDDIHRCAAALYPQDKFEASNFIGAHPNRLQRMLKIAPANAKFTRELAISYARIIFTEELNAALATAIQLATALPDVPVAIINAEEFSSCRQRYADMMTV